MPDEENQGGEFVPPLWFSGVAAEIRQSYLVNVEVSLINGFSAGVTCNACSQKHEGGETPDRCRAILARREESIALRSRVANRRARKLLMDNLSDAQLDEWAARNQFRVLTPKGRRFLITEGRVHNVRFEAGDPIFVNFPGHWQNPVRADEHLGLVPQLCVHLPGAEPVHDTLLAQKLMLECPETESQFFALANVGAGYVYG